MFGLCFYSKGFGFSLGFSSSFLPFSFSVSWFLFEKIIGLMMRFQDHEHVFIKWETSKAWKLGLELSKIMVSLLFQVYISVPLSLLHHVFSVSFPFHCLKLSVLIFPHMYNYVLSFFLELDDEIQAKDHFEVLALWTLKLTLCYVIYILG